MYCFTEIYSMFYVENEKVVPYNIYSILTPLGGSGSIRLQWRGLMFYTDCINVVDVVKLVNVLIVKYRLQCNLVLVKNKLIIYIAYRSSMYTLIRIIKL